MGSKTEVTAEEFAGLAESQPGLRDWRHEDGVLVVRYATGTFVKGLAFVTAVGDAAEEANHHPDVTLTYPYVELRLFSHDAGHVTSRDVALAARIAEIARASSIPATPA